MAHINRHIIKNCAKFEGVIVFFSRVSLDFLVNMETLQIFTVRIKIRIKTKGQSELVLILIEKTYKVLILARKSSESRAKSTITP